MMSAPEKNQLNLVLTGHWYDETTAGRKRVEYRSMLNARGKPSRWYGEIWLKRHQIKHVRFSRGYTPTTQLFSVVKIDIGPCHLPGWLGDYYRIHFTEQTDSSAPSAPSVVKS